VTGTGSFLLTAYFSRVHLELRKDLRPGSAANLPPWAPGSLFIHDRLCPALPTSQRHGSTVQTGPSATIATRELETMTLKVLSPLGGTGS